MLMSFRELARQWRAVVGSSGVRLECADDLEQLCDAWEQYLCDPDDLWPERRMLGTKEPTS